MHRCISITAQVIALTIMVGSAHAFDGSVYPDLKGQWTCATPEDLFDPTKPAGPGQQAPLTPEYQKILADSLAAQAEGRLGNDPTGECHAAGMPRMMSYQAQEYVVTPDVTYILLGGDDHLRRIITDGRDWPAKLTPTYQGYSIGHWIDTDGDGIYDVLEAETRGPFRGPRAYDSTGLPLASDNQSTFQERFFIDKAEPNLLHDVITVLDHALTRPWTADKTFRRNADAQPDWPEDLLPGDQPPARPRQGGLSPERPGRTPAHQAGSAAPRFQIFQAGAEVAGVDRDQAKRARTEEKNHVGPKLDRCGCGCTPLRPGRDDADRRAGGR